MVALHAAPHARAFVVPPSEERVRATIDQQDRERRIIVSADGTPVGFWALTVHGGGWLIEFNVLIALAPGRGVGSWGIRRMLARAFDDLGAHRVWLEVTADNAAARRVYEAAGFVLEGVFRDGFRDEHTGTYKDLCAYGLLASDG